MGFSWPWPDYLCAGRLLRHTVLTRTCRVSEWINDVNLNAALGVHRTIKQSDLTIIQCNCSLEIMIDYYLVEIS